MYIILVGCGRLGSALAFELSEIGHDVVVIDKKSDAFKRLGSEFNGVTVFGTGIDEDILKKSGIEQADAFIAVTDVDSVNIMAAQVAKYIFNVPKVIARVYDPQREYAYSELGIDTVCPNSLSVGLIKNSLITDKMHRLMQIGSGDAQIIDIKITKEHIGKSIDDFQVPEKFKIFAVIRGAETIIPSESFIINEGDILIAIIRIDAIETVKDILAVVEE